ncbi:MAG: hypothetical protein KAG66_18115, partial [Methylococcales bacterium]|nr:hypothetical protein [Methylococcales bacterium]
GGGGGGGGVSLGETSTTAYRGDRGKLAFDHSNAAHAPSDAVSGPHTVDTDTQLSQAQVDASAAASGYVKGDHTDTVAGITGLQGFLDGKEPGLGNPATDDFCLKSTILGARSWGVCGGGGGSVAWGAITGTLSAQADLQNALSAKVDDGQVLTNVPLGAVFTDNQDLTPLALKSNVLELDNATPFTPSSDYEPATFKYVADSVAAISLPDKVVEVVADAAARDVLTIPINVEYYAFLLDTSAYFKHDGTSWGASSTPSVLRYVGTASEATVLAAIPSPLVVDYTDTDEPVGGGPEVNDLGAAVTWANVPDTNITQGSVTQHESNINHNALTNYLAAEHFSQSAISISPVQAGLANVDNTSDADKPISTAQSAKHDTQDFAIAANTAKTGIPDGGTAGQALTKIDAVDGNVEWSDVTGGGGGGTFTPPTFFAASFSSGWSNNSTFGPVEYWKDSLGVVHIRGTADGGTG